MIDQTAAPRPGRSVAGWIALVVAGLLLFLTSFAVWVDRVALNTGVFVDTSSELIEDDAIRNAVATRAVDELFESIDVQAEIEDRAPEAVGGLSGLAAAGLRQASYELVDRALAQPSLQRVWAKTLEASHETLVLVLEGKGAQVSTQGGVVTLDLEQIVLEAAERIGIGDIARDRLPDEIGRIEILRSDELDAAQDGFQLLKRLAWVLPLLTLGAFALVLWLAGDRRRAVRRIGGTVLVVGVLGLVAATLTGRYVVSSLVAETDTRTAAGNAWDVVTELLRHTFRSQVVLGILLLLVAWLAGPGRKASVVRRTLAPAVRGRVWAYAALAAATLVLLVLSPVGDFTRLLTVVVLAALGAAWIELTRRQTLHEFPDASASPFFEDARMHLSSWWESRRATMTPEASTSRPPAADLTTRLATLADLHARGELTDKEFASAKARVLAGE
ncbi:MAG TPA: SHOCT domain-containing protein [Gaiellaceae bacterium]|nr:SHOCT domain-containing protein [Gaiellaceae bacterium]